jgi:hypothetical protein
MSALFSASNGFFMKMIIRWWRRRLPSVLLSITIIAALAVAIIAGTSAGGKVAQAVQCGASQTLAGRAIVPGHLIPALRFKHPLHPTDCRKSLHLAIAMQMRDRSGLDAFLAAVNDPHSPEFHHYLTPQQLADRFGPTPATIDRFTTFLRDQGFSHVTAASDRMLVDAWAPVATVEQAFAVNIADFAYAGRVVYAPTNEPSVPADLGGVLLYIGGLDDLPQAAPAPIH